jgi:hypothetical protein
LAAGDQLVVALAEESILADLARSHARRTLDNDVIVDMSALLEFGLMIAYRLRPDGTPQFVDFEFADRADD